MRLVPDLQASGGAGLRQLDAAGAAAANARRRALLDRLSSRADGRAGAESSFGGSKPHIGPLSPGCVRCGEGRWSCLFVGATCGGGCFFCPDVVAPPDAPPVAERVAFREPDDYAAYVATLGFDGIGFSGGEPFATGDRLERYVAAARARLPDAWLWAYTGGPPATAARIERAVRAGLDELRFDIACTDYDLAPLRRAVGRVPRVTVEIPAIPEDAPRLRALLPALVDAGVDHLHLHQLMAAGDSALRLAARGYHFTWGPSPPVVESEISALETLVYALDEGIGLPVQYCAAVYKDRWQGRVEDIRGWPLVRGPDEALTEAGFVRRLWRETTPTDPARPLRVQYWKTLFGEREEVDWARALPDYHDVTLSPTFTFGIRLTPVTAPVPLTEEDADALLAGDPPAMLVGCERIPEGLPDIPAPA